MWNGRNDDDRNAWVLEEVRRGWRLFDCVTVVEVVGRGGGGWEGAEEAYKCRYVFSPLTSIFRNGHLFCRWMCKMIYKHQRIKALPEHKYFTMDSSARSHWRNKIFTKKTSVLFPILPGHNSPLFHSHRIDFTPSLATGLPEAAKGLSLQKIHTTQGEYSRKKYATLSSITLIYTFLSDITVGKGTENLLL